MQELLYNLKELGVYTPLDPNLALDQPAVLSIYEKFATLILNDDPIMGAIENQALRLLHRCRQMGRLVGIPDFQMADLIEPDQIRFKKITTQLCKFCRWLADDKKKWDPNDQEILKQVKDTVVNITLLKRAEDGYSQMSQDHDLKKQKGEELKQQRIRMKNDFEQRKEQKASLQGKLLKDQAHKKEMEEKNQMAIEKKQVFSNEIQQLDRQLIDDPDKLKEILQKTQEREAEIQQQIYQKRSMIRLQQFQNTVYSQFINRTQTILAQANKNQMINNHFLQVQQKNKVLLNQDTQTANKISEMKEVIQELITVRGQLEQKKSQWMKNDTKLKQEGIKSLKDLQKFWSELEDEWQQTQGNTLKKREIFHNLDSQLQSLEDWQARLSQNMKDLAQKKREEVADYKQKMKSMILNLKIQ